jgi:preprotein translocase subunit SecB
MTLDYYKLIRNNVQLTKVELISMECYKRDVKLEEKQITLKLQSGVNLLDSKKAEAILRTIVGWEEEEEGPFLFTIVYRGICESKGEAEGEEFEEYVSHQVVSLLLPYARECVATTLARMNLPIYTIPTMDVLGSLHANKEADNQG